MRHLVLASLAVLALAGCTNHENRAVAPVSTGGTPGVAVTNPIDSSGRSNAVTTGSASNTASGSTVMQNAAPGAVR